MFDRRLPIRFLPFSEESQTYSFATDDHNTRHRSVLQSSRGTQRWVNGTKNTKRHENAIDLLGWHVLKGRAAQQQDVHILRLAHDEAR